MTVFIDFINWCGQFTVTDDQLVSHHSVSLFKNSYKFQTQEDFWVYFFIQVINHTQIIQYSSRNI